MRRRVLNGGPVPTNKLVVSTYLQYILLAVGAVLMVVFVRQLSGVLLTFLMAAVLAYLLNPLVRRLERWRVPRVVAVVGVFLVLAFVVVAGLLVLILPAFGRIQELVNNPQRLVESANSLVEQARGLPYVGERISTLDQQAIVGFLESNAPSAGQVLQTATGFIGGLFGVFGFLINLVLLIIISVYLLLDRERITRAVENTIPDTVRDQSLGLFHAVEAALVKYVRAQLLLCAIMAVIGWAIAFFVIDDYALPIGLWVGFTEIIPVIGAFLGAVPAVLIALIVGDFTTALIVAGLFLVAQQLEGNILVPRIMGGSVGVHPLWVLFAATAATALYGVVGAIFAVPVVAIVASTIRYLRGTLIFERWSEYLVKPATEEASPSAQGNTSAPSVTTGRRPGRGSEEPAREQKS